ncbi:hypothetical protein MRX96_027719 [Rhipicephalus microplus]
MACDPLLLLPTVPRLSVVATHNCGAACRHPKAYVLFASPDQSEKHGGDAARWKGPEKENKKFSDVARGGGSSLLSPSSAGASLSPGGVSGSSTTTSPCRRRSKTFFFAVVFLQAIRE